MHYSSMSGADFLNLSRYERMPAQEGLSNRLRELMHHNDFSEEVRSADAVFIAFDDISPTVPTEKRNLPLISGALEGIRYLANTHPERAEKDVRALLARRITDLYELARQGTLYTVDAQIQRQIEFSEELEGFINPADAAIQPFTSSIRKFQEAYARLSAANRISQDTKPAQYALQGALEAALERVQARHSATQAQLVSQEDRQLFAAAYARSRIQPRPWNSEVVLINSSQGARWLYQKRIADQAIREVERLPPGALSHLHIAHNLREAPLPYDSKQREKTAA